MLLPVVLRKMPYFSRRMVLPLFLGVELFVQIDRLNHNKIKQIKAELFGLKGHRGMF